MYELEETLPLEELIEWTVYWTVKDEQEEKAMSQRKAKRGR